MAMSNYGKQRDFNKKILILKIVWNETCLKSRAMNIIRIRKNHSQIHTKYLPYLGIEQILTAADKFLHIVKHIFANRGIWKPTCQVQNSDKCDTIATTRATHHRHYI